MLGILPYYLHHFFSTIDILTIQRQSHVDLDFYACNVQQIHEIQSQLVNYFPCQEIVQDIPIDLHLGWNLIGYPCYDNQDISLAFNNIDDEIISNVNETHISGFSVEIIKRDFYDNAYKMMNLDEKEHVTKYFYSSEEKKIFWMKNRRGLRPLALDTEDDYKKIIKLTNNPYNFSFETPISKMIDALK